MSITEETFYSTVDTGDLFLSGNYDTPVTILQLLTSTSKNKVFHVGIFIKLKQDLYILELSAPVGLKLTPFKRFKKKYTENVYIRYTNFTSDQKEQLKKNIQKYYNFYSCLDVSHTYLDRVVGINCRLHEFSSSGKKTFSGCGEFVYEVYKQFHKKIGGPLPTDFESDENKRVDFKEEKEAWYKLLSISILTSEVMKRMRVASSSATKSTTINDGVQNAPHASHP